MPQQKLNRVLANRAYADLCNRVEAIDADAAKYMRSKECVDLQSFYQSFDVSGSFAWSETPQGVAYWANISDKLGE